MNSSRLVLDLASSGRAMFGYASLKPGQSAAVFSIGDKKGIDPKEIILINLQRYTLGLPPVPSGNGIPVAYRHLEGDLFDLVEQLPPDSFNDIHFHNMDGGQMDFHRTKLIFNKVGQALKADGCFYFSFDNLFFKDNGKGFAQNNEGIFASMIHLLQESGLSVEFAHFGRIAFWTKKRYFGSFTKKSLSVCTPKADAIAQSFGIPDMGENWSRFLLLFSDYEIFAHAFNRYIEPSFIVSVKQG